MKQLGTIMRFWRFLNSRLVTALLSIAVVFAVAWMTLGGLSRGFFDNRDSERVETLARLQLLSLHEVETPKENAQKFVGKVRNNSFHLVTSISGAVAFYEDDNTLKDLFTQKLEGISLLKAGQEAEFVIVRPGDRDTAGGSPMKTKSRRVEFRVVDVSISKEKAP